VAELDMARAAQQSPMRRVYMSANPQPLRLENIPGTLQAELAELTNVSPRFETRTV
jgi:hypothetical protein